MEKWQEKVISKVTTISLSKDYKKIWTEFKDSFKFIEGKDNLKVDFSTDDENVVEVKSYNYSISYSIQVYSPTEIKIRQVYERNTDEVSFQLKNEGMNKYSCRYVKNNEESDFKDLENNNLDYSEIINMMMDKLVN